MAKTYMLKNTILKVYKFNTLSCLKRQTALVFGYLHCCIIGLPFKTSIGLTLLPRRLGRCGRRTDTSVSIRRRHKSVVAKSRERNKERNKIGNVYAT